MTACADVDVSKRNMNENGLSGYDSQSHWDYAEPQGRQGKFGMKGPTAGAGRE